MTSLEREPGWDPPVELIMPRRLRLPDAAIADISTTGVSVIINPIRFQRMWFTTPNRVHGLQHRSFKSALSNATKTVYMFFFCGYVCSECQEVFLEQQLRSTPSSAPVPTTPDPEEIRRIVLSEISTAFNTMRETLGNELADKLTFYTEQLRGQVDYLEQYAKVLRDPANWEAKALTLQGESAISKVRMVPMPDSLTVHRKTGSISIQNVPAPTKRQLPTNSPENGDLTGPERRLLNAIAWMEAISVPQPEQPAVAFLAGYTYGGGAYNNPRGRLNQRGLVRYVGSNQIELTDEGRKLAEFPEAIGSDEELHQKVLDRLPGPEQRLLTPLLKHWPKAMSNEQLANAANYTAGAGAFNNPRGRLRNLGLIEYPASGMVRARDILFPSGR